MESKVWDYLESDGAKTVNHEIGKFTRILQTRGTVTAPEREAFMEWLRNEGMYEAATRVQLLPSVLNDLAKEVDRGEREDIPGLGVFFVKQIRFTEAKE